LKLFGKEGTNKNIRILVLSTYSAYPTIHGGQTRLYELYQNLAKSFDVTILSLPEMDKPAFSKTLENGLKQICIPESKEQAEKKFKIERALNLPLHDINTIDSFELSKDFLFKAKELIKKSDVIVFTQPYLFELSKYVDNKIKIYDSQNVEYNLKLKFFKQKTKEVDKLIKKVFDIEKRACLKSDIIFCASEEDKDDFVKLYSAKEKKMVMIPNGINVKKVRFITKEEKINQKINCGLDKSQVIIFVGSWHPPNLEALEYIVKISQNLPDSFFFIIGNIKDYYMQQHPTAKLPKNVLMFGMFTFDDPEKFELYKLADIAVNPMFSGSGTNIKMLDYMSAGIPVISTKIGARGLGIANGKDAIVCEPSLFVVNMKKLLKDKKLQQKMRLRARRKVEDEFDWEKISEIAKDNILRLVGDIV
jgi:glycosyltransferase involved in cell wall biosynthesis